MKTRIYTMALKIARPPGQAATAEATGHIWVDYDEDKITRDEIDRVVLRMEIAVNEDYTCRVHIDNKC